MNCDLVQRKLRLNPEQLTEIEMNHVPDCVQCFAAFESSIEQPLSARLREETVVAAVPPAFFTGPSQRWLTRFSVESALLPLVAALTALAVFLAWPVIPELSRMDQRLSSLDSIPIPQPVETLVALSDSELTPDLAVLPVLDPLTDWQITSWRADNGRIKSLIDFDQQIEIESL